jgi:CHAT domain-containing protein
VFSLANSFINAGASYVIATKTSIEDKATSIFAKNFYTHLINTDNIITSFHSAQLDLINHSEYSHPFFWSNYVLSMESL